MANILIIDDDDDFASSVATVLRDEGHDVRMKLDPKSGLAELRQRRPDLLVLDVMFPEDATAGFDLARTVRNKSSDLKDLPILMLTAVNARFPLGFGSKDIDEDWLPVNDFLEKPVDLDLLVSRVKEILARHPTAA
jgi:DNA-binding response OmpR family regulator